MDKIAAVEKIVHDANERLAVLAGDEFEIKIIKNKRLSNLIVLKTDALFKMTCDEFEVRAEDVRGPHRYQELVNARFTFYLLAAEVLNMSRKAIGYYMNRHYSSVVVGIQEIKKHMEFEGDLRNHIYFIKKRYYENYDQAEA